MSAACKADRQQLFCKEIWFGWTCRHLSHNKSIDFLKTAFIVMLSTTAVCCKSPFQTDACMDVNSTTEHIINYSGGDKTSVKTLKSDKAYISHNKAKNPINLGAK